MLNKWVYIYVHVYTILRIKRLLQLSIYLVEPNTNNIIMGFTLKPAILTDNNLALNNLNDKLRWLIFHYVIT